MLDIKWVRSHPEETKEAMKRRNKNMDSVIDEIIEIDRQRREISAERDEKKAKQNRISKEIPIKKKNGEDVSELLADMKRFSEEVKESVTKASELEQKQKRLLLQIPNIPHPSVPVGADDSQNEELRRFGEPRQFSFQPKPHWDLGKELGILDPERAAKVTGSRFHFYKGLGARLERAVISFYLDTHTKHGYTEVLPPFLVNRDSMTGTGQLPKFEEDAFHIENVDYFLIPTAEVPVTNIYRDEIMEGKELPIKYCAYSACFRAEAGAAGRDVRGLIRQHQFNKVELVHFARPEDSYKQLEELTNDAERVLQALKLPYRVVCLCGGDLGFSSAKTYDIEVWLPSYNNYKEISSCSNFEDYQARRANIRYKDNAKDKAEFVHTLNGSGVAIGRTVAAIVENYQQEDGSIKIPEVLVPYMGVEEIR